MIDCLPNPMQKLWWRMHWSLRLVLAPFVLVGVVIAGILVFASILTWLPIVYLISEMVSREPTDRPAPRRNGDRD